MTLQKTWLLACALIAVPTVAFADEEAETEVTTETTTTNADGSTTTETTNVEVETETETTPAPGAAVGMNARGVTLAKSKAAIGGSLGIFKTSDGEGGTTVGLGLSVGIGYGITDKIEGGLSYSFALKDFEIKGPLLAYGKFNAISDAKMQLAPMAAIGYDINGEYIQAGLGADFRFHLNDQMMIYTPNNVPTPNRSFSTFSVPNTQLVILHDSVDTGTGDSVSVTPILLFLPVGFGYQVDPTIQAFAETNLGVIGISDADGLDGFIFADFIPLRVGAWYTAGQVDVGLSVESPDLPDIADNFNILAMGRFNM